MSYNIENREHIDRTRVHWTKQRNKIKRYFQSRQFPSVILNSKIEKFNLSMMESRNKNTLQVTEISKNIPTKECCMWV